MEFKSAQKRVDLNDDVFNVLMRQLISYRIRNEFNMNPPVLSLFCVSPVALCSVFVQVLSACHTLFLHPSSKVARENVEVFMDVWKALDQDVTALAQEVSELCRNFAAAINYADHDYNVCETTNHH